METDNVNEEAVDTPSEPIPEAADVPAADSEETVEAVAKDSDALTLDQINEATGRNYKDIDTALKSLKDTRVEATKAGEYKKALDALATGESSELAEQVKALREDNFYSKNPQYEGVRDLINQMGGDPQEVVQTDAFKSAFEKISGYEKTQSTKSVLETNPRIGQVKSKMTDAREAIEQSRDALAKGDVAGSVAAHEAAANTAIDSVIDAYDI